MHRKYRLALAIASIVLFIVALTATGVSYAVWTSPEGGVSGEGTTTVSPSVNANDGYVWAKYFNFVPTEGNSKYAAITTFYADGAQAAGLNLADVYIPEEFWVKKDGTRLYVKEDLVGLTAGVDYDVYTTKIITNRIFYGCNAQTIACQRVYPKGRDKNRNGRVLGTCQSRKSRFQRFRRLHNRAIRLCRLPETYHCGEKVRRLAQRQERCVVRILRHRSDSIKENKL